MKDIMSLTWLLLSAIALSKFIRGAGNLYPRPCMRNLAPLEGFFFEVMMWESWNGVFVSRLRDFLLHWFFLYR